MRVQRKDPLDRWRIQGGGDLLTAGPSQLRRSRLIIYEYKSTLLRIWPRVTNIFKNLPKSWTIHIKINQIHQNIVSLAEEKCKILGQIRIWILIHYSRKRIRNPSEIITEIILILKAGSERNICGVISQLSNNARIYIYKYEHFTRNIYFFHLQSSSSKFIILN